MAFFIVLSLILCYILVYGYGWYVNEHTYFIPSEIKHAKRQIKDDNIIYNIPFHFLKHNPWNSLYDEHRESILKDNEDSGEYLCNYASTFDHMNFIYDHNKHNYKRNKYGDYIDNLNADLLNSRSLQVFNQHDGNQKVHDIALKPIAVLDSQLRNYQHETKNILEALDIKSPITTVQYKSYINNRQNELFNTFSNAPGSIFHTQVNVNSPGSKLNVINNFPLSNDVSTEINDAGEILVPVMDEATQNTDEGIHSIEVILTPNRTQVNLFADLEDDGYHYDRPRMNFFY